MIIISGPLPPTEKAWMQLDATGKLTHIEWHVAEQLATAYAVGSRDPTIVLAAVVVAVREHILNAKIPDLPKTGGKP